MWLLSSVSLCVFVLFLFFSVFCVLSLIATSAAQRNYSSSRVYSVTGTFKKMSCYSHHSHNHKRQLKHMANKINTVKIKVMLNLLLSAHLSGNDSSNRPVYVAQATQYQTNCNSITYS